MGGKAAAPIAATSSGVPTVDGYQITGRLGEGGMGVVWRAVQLSTKRPVALKLMSAASLGSTKSRSRFAREVELAASLQHANVARVYDSGLHEGMYYYAMELVDGQPLDEFCAARNLSVRQTLGLMRRVCRAVQYAHQRGVIHRDLKPSNVLVSKDGQPHVLDFGLAKAMSGADGSAAAAVSVAGEVAGTPAYMSPEQAAGLTDALDTRSDVYTLGVIVYRLLTGTFPHDVKGSHLDVIRRVAEEDPTAPRKVRRDLDAEVEAVLLKSLARDPEERYQSAAALAEDVTRYLDGEPVEARRASLFYVLSKRLRKHRGRMMLAAAVAGLLVATAVGAYVRVVVERNRAEGERARADRERAAAVSAATAAEAARASLAEKQASLVTARNEAVAAAEREKKAADAARSANEALRAKQDELITARNEALAAAEEARQSAQRERLAAERERQAATREAQAKTELSAGQQQLAKAQDEADRVKANNDRLRAIDLVKEGEAALAAGHVTDGIGRLHRAGQALKTFGAPTLAADLALNRAAMLAPEPLIVVQNLTGGQAGVRVNGLGAPSCMLLPDGRTAVVALPCGEIAYHVDLPTGRQTRFFQSGNKLSYELSGHGPTLSADGRSLLMGFRPGREVFELRVADLQTEVLSEPLLGIGTWFNAQGNNAWLRWPRANPDGAALWPDGKTVAVMLENKMHFWSLPGREYTTADIRTPNTGPFAAFAPLPDRSTLHAGKRILVLGRDGGSLHTFEAPGYAQDNYATVITSPDGRWGLVATPADQSLHIVNVAERTVRRVRPEFARQEDRARLALSANGTRAAAITTAKDGNLRVWDTASGQLVAAATEMRGAPQSTPQSLSTMGVALSPDGDLAVVGGTGVSCYRLGESRFGRVLNLPGLGGADAMKVSADGRIIVSFHPGSASSGRLPVTVRVTDAATTLPLAEFGAAKFESWAVSPDGTLLAGADAAAGRVVILSTMNGRVAGVSSFGQTARNSRSIRALAFTPDGQSIFALLEDWAEMLPPPLLRIPATGGDAKPAGPHAPTMRLDGGTADLQVSPDGTLVACTFTTEYKTKRGAWLNTEVWDVAAGTLLHSKQIARSTQRVKVRFSQDAMNLYVGDGIMRARSGAISGWLNGDAARWDHIHGNGGATTAVDDGKWEFRDAATGTALPFTAAAGLPVAQVDFSADGALAVTRSPTGELRLWDFTHASEVTRRAPDAAAAVKTIAAKADDGPALIVLAQWYALRGVDAWSDELFRRGRKGLPTRPRPLGAARAHWLTGHHDDADAAFREALKAGEAPEAYIRLCLAGVEFTKSRYKGRPR